MKNKENHSELYFLNDGGEMGELIRRTHWCGTTLGEPALWPQALQTAVAIMLNNPFGMYIAWGNEYIQLYNDGYRPILGASKHPHALGRSSKETFKEIWHIIESMFDDVMKGKAIGFPDFMLPLNRNGFLEKCYFDFAYSPIFNTDGKVGGVLVTVIETTQRKISVDELQKSEERFRSMADNIPNLAWMANADGWIFWYNKTWYDYTGTSPDQMEGWGWQSVHHPDELPKVLENWKTSIITGKPFEMIFPIKNALGIYRTFLTRVIPIRNKENKIYQWFGTNTDITESIEAANRLKESEQNLRNIITLAPVAMCILKGDQYTVNLANTLMFELWGKTPEQVMNRPIFEGLPEAKNQGLETLLDGVFKTGKTFSAQNMPVSLPRNGILETIYVNFVYEAYLGDNGSVTGIIAVAIDVTDQVVARQKIEFEVKRQTAQLAETNQNLKKSNAELAQFAYIASHDLQEPLRKISTFANMLENKLSTADEQSKKYLSKIQTSADRMTSLIRDVLAYSDLVKDNGGFEKVNLNKIIKKVLDDFDVIIREKNASIICDKLPVIEAIPLQMSQLFGNLISNALKFSRKNVKSEVTISATLISFDEKKILSLEQSIEYYLIRFADNGIGLSPEQSRRIFNIFQRLHPKSEYEGTGIGLAICKKIAVNHNGDINAENSSEKGAVFNIFIPVAQHKIQKSQN